MYYGLQATGMDAGMAGNFVQLIIFLGICVGWIGSYLFRVANKVGVLRPTPSSTPSPQQMTYVQQLKDYEEAVMVKRLEELPASEQARLMDVGFVAGDPCIFTTPQQEVEGEREQREARRKAWQEAQKKQEQ